MTQPVNPRMLNRCLERIPTAVYAKLLTVHTHTSIL